MSVKSKLTVTSKGMPFQPKAFVWSPVHAKRNLFHFPCRKKIWAIYFSLDSPFAFHPFSQRRRATGVAFIDSIVSIPIESEYLNELGVHQWEHYVLLFGASLEPAMPLLFGWFITSLAGMVEIFDLTFCWVVLWPCF